MPLLTSTRNKAIIAFMVAFADVRVGKSYRVSYTGGFSPKENNSKRWTVLRKKEHDPVTWVDVPDNQVVTIVAVQTSPYPMIAAITMEAVVMFHEYNDCYINFNELW